MNALPTIQTARKSHFTSATAWAAGWRGSRSAANRATVPTPKMPIQRAGKMNFVKKVCAEERVRGIDRATVSTFGGSIRLRLAAAERRGGSLSHLDSILTTESRASVANAA